MKNMRISTWFKNPDNRLILLILAFSTLLLPFIAVSFFTFPSTDDYCHTLAVKDLGYWGYQEHYWKTWSGRYTGTLISATQPLIYESYTGYKIAPIVLLIVYVHAFIYFVRAFTLDKLTRWQTGLFAFLLLFTMLAEMPVISGYFYWYTGYYYTVADIGTLYFFGYLFRNYSKISRTNIAAMCFALILLVGMNEYTLVWLVILSGSLFFFSSITRKRIQWKELILALVALTFGILSVTAPGNFARAESGLYPTPLKYDLLFSLKNSFLWSIHNFTKMAPTLCLLTLVLIPYAARMYHSRQKNEFRFLFIHPAISILIFAGCLYLSYFPSYWSIAEPPNLRGQCIINFWTLLGWIFNVFVLIFWAMEKHDIKIITHVGVYKWVVGLYFLLLYSGNFNYRSAWSDLLTGRAKRYHEEMISRTEMVLNTKDYQIYVPKLKNLPYTILMPTGDMDPAWASVEKNNGCAEWYFGKKFFYK
ncbi:hypothetical protein [Dyadobacter bucti]|uniref:hypothetical protein n=1 Tax=Dyadobacter bucti TaxID=2572203 RepID=UPI001E61D836|nr:hypothetical protein [Dyadobacter bucti]